MSAPTFVACDLGADSGRVILAKLAGGHLQLEDVHRFDNGPLRLFGTLRWDIIGIYRELLAGLGKVAAGGATPAGVSVDSWGVDYVYLNAREPLLAIPFHYRDGRNDAAYEKVLAKVGRELVFAETGIQFMVFNTLYQLFDDLGRAPEVLGCADCFLGIADYLNYLLSGVARAEESLASTTQIYDPGKRAWSAPLLEALGFPAKIFPAVVPSGTVLGPLLPAVAAETGLGETRVIATCSHDTGAAVAAAPGAGDDWAYLSSGTWSLMGVELDRPCRDERARAHNFTNEVGCGGSIRFLKNITGMWLIQECRRHWLRDGQTFSFDQLDAQATACAPLRSLIQPNAPRFARPDNMPEKIREYCAATGQPVPGTPGEIVRCILESLALSYRRVLDEIETVTGRRIGVLHIVGGGTRNRVLNQFAADATEREVVTGPVEATAVGNALIQALAVGRIGSLAELRKIVRDSFPLGHYRPRQPGAWADAYGRFAALDPAI